MKFKISKASDWKFESEVSIKSLDQLVVLLRGFDCVVALDARGDVPEIELYDNGIAREYAISQRRQVSFTCPACASDHSMVDVYHHEKHSGGFVVCPVTGGFVSLKSAK